MIRMTLLAGLSFATASLLLSGLVGAQPSPPPGVPAVAGAPPPPPPPAVAGAAAAIQGVTPQYVEKPDFNASGKKQGWDPRLSIGSTAAFANNTDVAGQPSGNSVSFGLKLDTGMEYNLDSHEWRSGLVVGASATRTPVIQEFVKTSDVLALDSIYLYHVLPWFGPFARASFQTSMFKGTDVRPAPVTYQITLADGTLAPASAPATHLRLSDAFAPVTIKESAGLFVQPHRSDPVTVEARAGLGAQQVMADNQFTLKDDVTTPAIEVRQLKSVNQLGGELALSVWGAILDKKLTYRVNADVMTPFVHSTLLATDKRDSFALTNVQVDATISYRLVQYASLDYQFKVLRQPEVIDAVQVQNTLLLTFGYSFGGKAPAPPPCAPPPPPPAPPAAPSPAK